MTSMLSHEIPDAQPVIEVSDLIYTYSGSRVPALNGLSFSVGKGEIFGLLGPNGAGKTTALSILSTLLRPENGKVFLDGIDVSKQNKQVRRIIGFVPQEIALYSNFTVIENLRYFGRLCGLRGKILKNHIMESLEAVDLVNKGNSLTKHLSSGMKRRVNIAAALVNSPGILLLDEPTVGVDTQTRKLIFEKLNVLKSSGMTMIYTTHYMEDAEQLCDRITIIDNGESIAEGAPDRLIEDNQGCENLEDVFLSMTGRQIRN